MTTLKNGSKAVAAKRGQGRPVAGENNVGSERLLNAAEKLLRELPPAKVTIARIAQEANADPALVRYYFGNRTALLLAVVDRMTNHGVARAAAADEAPDVALANHIRMTLKFTRSAPFMHRLMIEELTEASDDETRSRVRAMNLDLVALYRRLLKADGGQTLQSVNPLYLHLLVLGASDFFATAEPLIRDLVPANTSMDRLAAGFQDFMVKVIVDGLRKA
jgi:AcrR family transcriptional regulator